MRSLILCAKLSILLIGYVAQQNKALATILPTGRSQQCEGIFIDTARFRSVSEDETNELLSVAQGFAGGLTFAAREIHHVKTTDQSTCVAERHRLREQIMGVPIVGSDFVVTSSVCREESLKRSMVNVNTLALMDSSAITTIQGYVISNVHVPTGSSPKHSEEEVQKAIAGQFNATIDAVSSLKLEVYPTQEQDYLTWIGTILIEAVPSEPELHQIFVNDENFDIILRCEIGGLTEKQQKLRGSNKSVQRKIQQNDSNETSSNRDRSSMCNSCATRGENIEWTDEIVQCPVETLYLNNEGRSTLCIKGNGPNGTTFVGPGPIPDYNWGGVSNCNVWSEGTCQFSPLPECPDSINDIQWNAIRYFQYIGEHLGIMGGIQGEETLKAQAHYNLRFCNAFYMPFDNMVSFGDCNCDQLTPLVSTDVVTHELTHALTWATSGLFYFFQAGGLNEAFSDIMAVALEFAIDDSKDTGDLLIGESLLKNGSIRDLEFPAMDGNSIESFCEYESGMTVHHSSGFLNRAYAKSVRACESICGTNTSECAVLMANTFMYANVETLCMFSGFRDAARQICEHSEEYMLVNTPDTACSPSQVRSAIREGFTWVDIDLSDDCRRASVRCERPSFVSQCLSLATNIGEALYNIYNTVCFPFWES